MTKSQLPEGSIRLSRKGIFLRKGGRDCLIGDPLRVAAFVDVDDRDAQGDAAHYVELRFTNRSGKNASSVLDAATVAKGGKDLIGELAKTGYLVPESRYHHALASAIAAARPKLTKRGVIAPGWWDGSYLVKPGEQIDPPETESATLILFARATVKLGACNRRGKLSQWRKHIGALGKCSSRARFLIGASFAALILRLVGRPSFAINLHGPSSISKTFLLRVAASVQGNIDEGSIATLDGTPAGLEQRLVGHRDGFLPLDEIGHLGGWEKEISAFLRGFSFRQASGRPRVRAGQYAHAVGLADVDCRNIVCMTSERSIAAINKIAMAKRLPGETVRLIELPACHGKWQDVFDKRSATKKVGEPGATRRARIEVLEQLLNQLQGTAARAFLRRLVRDKEAKRKLEDYTSEFMRKVEPRLAATTDGRIAGHFAIVAAALRLAIQYRILDWKNAAAQRDIRVCLFDALASMNDLGSATPIRNDTDLLNGFKDALVQLKVLDLDAKTKASVDAEQIANCDAFRRTLPGDKRETLFIKSSWLKGRYGKAERKRLLDLCIGAGMMRKGGRSADTQTHQEKVGGKPIEVYRVIGGQPVSFGVSLPSRPLSRAPLPPSSLRDRFVQANPRRQSETRPRKGWAGN